MSSNTHSSDELRALESLRAHRRKHRTAYRGPDREGHLYDRHVVTTGQRVSDWVAKTVGSWRFIVFQTVAIVVWISYNVTSRNSWDPYPFILLNLLLSFQAAYTAPAIMMSQNRQAEIDRQNAQNDFEVNVKAELEIELLHQKIDLLKEKELLELTQAVMALSRKLDTQ